MKEKTQNYYVELLDNPELAEIGHPIVDGDVVVGFIFNIMFDGRAEIVLWEATEIEFLDNMENVEPFVENTMELFEIAMGKATENVREQWKEMIRSQK